MSEFDGINWVKCPECGNAVSDTSKQCPTCNTNIKKYLEEKKRETEKRKGKTGCLLWIVLLIIIVSSIIAKYTDLHFSNIAITVKEYTKIPAIVTYIFLPIIPFSIFLILSMNLDGEIKKKITSRPKVIFFKVISWFFLVISLILTTIVVALGINYIANITGIKSFFFF